MTPIQAEVKLVQLKNCFVNVPQSVVTVLDNVRAVSSTKLPASRRLLTEAGSSKCRRGAPIQRRLPKRPRF